MVRLRISDVNESCTHTDVLQKGPGSDICQVKLGDPVAVITGMVASCPQPGAVMLITEFSCFLESW